MFPDIPRLDLAARLDPVHTRHHQVEKNKIRGLELKLFDTANTAVGDQYSVTCLVQKPEHNINVCRYIIDYHYGFHQPLAFILCRIPASMLSDCLIRDSIRAGWPGCLYFSEPLPAESFG